MRKKINSEAGFSLVELIVVMAIMVLLGLMLTAGMRMATHTYRTVIAQSEVELLLSSAVDALADELRYAWDVEGDLSNAECDFTYYSDSYGEGTSLTAKYHEGDVDYTGQIIANSKYTDDSNVLQNRPWQVLPTGSYGGGIVMPYKEYEVAAMKITHKEIDGEIIFTIYLKVATADGKISAETPGDGVTVRCLNPPKDLTS